MTLSTEAVIGLVTLLIMCIPAFVLFLRLVRRSVHGWLPVRPAVPILPLSHSRSNTHNTAFEESGLLRQSNSLSFAATTVHLYQGQILALELRDTFLMVHAHPPLRELTTDKKTVAIGFSNASFRTRNSQGLPIFKRPLFLVMEVGESRARLAIDFWAYTRWNGDLQREWSEYGALQGE